MGSAPPAGARERGFGCGGCDARASARAAAPRRRARHLLHAPVGEEGLGQTRIKKHVSRLRAQRGPHGDDVARHLRCIPQRHIGVGWARPYL